MYSAVSFLSFFLLCFFLSLFLSFFLSTWTGLLNECHKAHEPSQVTSLRFLIDLLILPPDLFLMDRCHQLLECFHHNRRQKCHSCRCCCLTSVCLLLAEIKTMKTVNFFYYDCLTTGNTWVEYGLIFQTSAEWSLWSFPSVKSNVTIHVWFKYEMIVLDKENTNSFFTTINFDNLLSTLTTL